MNTAPGLLVVLLGILLFFSPVVLWVAAAAPAWWWPFVVWAGFIGLIFFSQRRHRDS